MRWILHARDICALAISGILLVACDSAPQAGAPTLAQPAASALAATTAAPSTAPQAQPMTPAPTAAQPAQPTVAAVAPAATAAPAATDTTPTLDRTLRLQDPNLQGDDVKAAQQRLLDLGYAQAGAADGIFGLKTEAAVRAFQAANDLTVDGIVGPQTWGRLFSSATAQAPEIIPIVDSQSGWLLGASADGKWITALDAPPQVRGNDTYRLYTLTGSVGTAVGGRPESLGPVPCATTTVVELNPRPPSRAIGVAGDWNLQPRTPREVDPKAQEFQQLVGELLKSQGISQPDIRIVKVVRVDLDGDGAEEVLISATRYADGGEPLSPNAAAGDYSLLVLRKSVGGAMQTINIVAEYYPNAQEFSAPSAHQLLAVLDLNGDGVMELVVDSSYYEGGATLVYSITGNTVQQVIGSGCGV